MLWSGKLPASRRKLRVGNEVPSGRCYHQGLRFDVSFHYFLLPFQVDRGGDVMLKGIMNKLDDAVNEFYEGRAEMLKYALISWRKEFKHPHPYASVCEDMEREGGGFTAFAEKEIEDYTERYKDGI